jgi:copper homeostasis protein
MNDQVSIEICVDSVASAIAAEQGGAQRVELCASLSEGGITPSAGLIESARAKISIGLQIMVRPRGGDFRYSGAEFNSMRRDIQFAKQSGADGVVFGILDSRAQVDVDRTRELVGLARPLSVTFHRAFDVSSDLFRSLEDICKTGADKILTSGGAPTACEAIPTLGSLVQAATGRVSILACGGIRANNAAKIIDETGVREIHSGVKRPLPGMTSCARRSLTKTTLGAEHERFQVFAEDVQDLRRAVLSR